MEDGDVLLLNGTATFQSVVRYSCHDNFTLTGVDTRTCLETGLWSDVEPSCDSMYRNDSTYVAHNGQYSS